MDKKECLERLKQSISELVDKREAVETELNARRQDRSALYNMLDEKKKGNVFLIISAVLIVAEILAVMFHSPFEFVDLLIIAPFLIVGIIRKSIGIRRYKESKAKLQGITFEQLSREISDLDMQLNAIIAEIDEKDMKFEELTQYTGDYWVIAKTASTPTSARELVCFDPATMDKLEKDFCELVECITLDEYSSLIDNGWLTAAITQKVLAHITKDDIVNKKFDHTLGELQKQLRWPLILMNAMIMTAGLNVMSRSWNMDQDTSLEEGLVTIIHEKFIPEEYQELYDNAQIAFDRIVEALVAEVKKHA